MTAIGPGDLLEAIEGHEEAGYSIVRGRIYVCTAVAPAAAFLGQCEHGPQCRAGGVNLREVPAPPLYYWCAAMFRPVGRPAQSIIASLKIGARDSDSVAA